ncbi:MAG: flagellar hook protein FlgE [Peptococcaceae bacterium]
MMRSLFAGVSGLRAHQTRMDVIGNNISNVNTPGFKKSRVTFQEMLNQTMRGASSPQGDRAGTNPLQIGLGVNLGSIDVIHTAGSPQSTGKALDMSIEGEGYFIVGDATNSYYTRAGNFDFDTENNLHLNGYLVKGWVATQDPITNELTLDNSTAIRPINLSALADAKIMQATTAVSIGKNLDKRTEIQSSGDVSTFTDNTYTGQDIGNADPVDPGTWVTIELGSGVVFDDNFSIEDGSGNSLSYTDLIANMNDWDLDISTGELTIKNGATFTGFTGTNNVVVNYQQSAHPTPVTVFDSQGDSHEVMITYYKNADNQWKVSVGLDGDLVDTGYEHTLNFNSTGQIDPATSTINITKVLGGGVDDLDATINFGNLTQVAADTSALALSQNGFEPGSLQSISVDTTGTIVGTFSNGQNIELAQVALATFANAGGLEKIGNTLFRETKNSGLPQTGFPGQEGKGVIKPETLEMSNVDLSQEFVDMIVTQRGFQANSRIITTSDQMLEELVNLRR